MLFCKLGCELYRNLEVHKCLISRIYVKKLLNISVLQDETNSQHKLSIMGIHADL